jgi:spermidine/putrescine-binding protein
MRQSTAYRARFDRGVAVDYAVPREGSVYKCFYRLVPTDAPGPMAALRLANRLCRPEAAAALFEREGAVPAAGVGDELPDDVASYLRRDDDWTLYGTFPLPDELSARYAGMVRDLF